LKKIACAVGEAGWRLEVGVFDFVLVSVMKMKRIGFGSLFFQPGMILSLNLPVAVDFFV